ALPGVERADSGNQVDAGGEALAHQGARQLDRARRLLPGGQGAENNGDVFACHGGRLPQAGTEWTSARIRAINGGEPVALIVQKFGGTSVRDLERIRAAARRALATQREGHRVAVVVSAMAGETN